MVEQMQDDQLEPIYNSSVLIQDIAWKTYRERWTIDMGGERGPGRSVLATRHDDDMSYVFVYSLCTVKWIQLMLSNTNNSI